jgi:DNA-binding LacI/PurR family transcriptional regulator
MSVISHRVEEMGERAADLAVDLAEGKDPGKNKTCYIPSVFVKRESTGRAKQGGHY